MPILNLLIWRNVLFWGMTHMLISDFVRAQFITLDSIELYTKHDWFKLKHTVYFQCKGENKTVLPDVSKTGILYTFLGQESWQPMTEISGKKCKRCGFYEQGSLISDKELDEWEVCPSDFSASQIYKHSKEQKLNATFVCHGCAKLDPVFAKATASRPEEEEGDDNGITTGAAILVGVLFTTLVVFGGVFMFRQSQRKKKQRDQARFMKLFEDSDEPEDELGLESVI